jgi:hypothetical protein
MNYSVVLNSQIWANYIPAKEEQNYKLIIFEFWIFLNQLLSVIIN